MRIPWLTRLSNCLGMLILLERGQQRILVVQKWRLLKLDKSIWWLLIKSLIADQLNFRIIAHLSSRLNSFTTTNDPTSYSETVTSRITYFKQSHNDSLKLISQDSLELPAVVTELPPVIASKADQNDHTNSKINSSELATENFKMTTMTNTKPKAVIISAFMRSGSSLVGEVFNNHPDAFYSFEPLHGSVI